MGFYVEWWAGAGRKAPDSPHLADNAYEVRPGWWIDTHASRAGIETRIKMACEVAGVKYGKDLVVDLG